MRASFLAIVLSALALWPNAAAAHPAPFTYLDVRLRPGAVDTILVAHAFDLAHDLKVDSQERLLDPAYLRSREAEIAQLMTDRILLGITGGPLKPGRWSSIVPLPDRQAVQMEGRFELGPDAGSIQLRARLFPYDPAHQTFVNIYERDALTLQAILDLGKTDLEYYPGSRQGVFAVLRRFVPEGFRHIASGSDHWLFLIGLLLVGGTPRRCALILGALVAGHAVAGALTALNIVRPLPRIIEPAIALSIIYAGADNLLVRGGRDLRGWIALAFGFVHGFWFAGALRQMALPKQAIVWSLFSFELGAELAHFLIIAAVATVAMLIRSRGGAAARRVTIAGSLIVIAGGVYLFVTRVFFQAWTA